MFVYQVHPIASHDDSSLYLVQSVFGSNSVVGASVPISNAVGDLVVGVVTLKVGFGVSDLNVGYLVDGFFVGDLVVGFVLIVGLLVGFLDGLFVG